jgi:hypothetical protein
MEIKETHLAATTLVVTVIGLFCFAVLVARTSKTPDPICEHAGQSVMISNDLKRLTDSVKELKQEVVTMRAQLVIYRLKDMESPDLEEEEAPKVEKSLPVPARQAAKTERAGLDALFEAVQKEQEALKNEPLCERCNKGVPLLGKTWVVCPTCNLGSTRYASYKMCKDCALKSNVCQDCGTARK